MHGAGDNFGIYNIFDQLNGNPIFSRSRLHLPMAARRDLFFNET